jgi:YD repeat-containing protein
VKRTLLAVVLALCAAATSFAQQHPVDARGFAADKVYSFGDLDSVNMFNGNLTVALPLGQQYRAGGVLPYQFSLVYNSKVWDWNASGYPVGCQHCNAGLGWNLSLGRLIAPNDPTANSTSWVYESPDGAGHGLQGGLHSQTGASAYVWYSNDSTYLRMSVLSQAVPVQRRIEFSDGSSQIFSEYTKTTNDVPWGRVNTPGSGVWRLTQITDRFNNSVNIQYSANATYAEIWHVTDGPRHHWAYFASQAGMLTQKLDHVTLTAFNNQTATYSFGYQTIEVAKPHGDPNPTGSTFVPVLVRVTLPTGLSFRMTQNGLEGGEPAYDTASETSGVLRKLRLPTLGYLEWEYSSREYSAASYSGRTSSPGISKRMTVGADNVTIGTWTYDHRRSQPVSCTVTCPSGSGSCSAGGSRQLVTSVTHSLDDGSTVSSINYFSIYFAHALDERGVHYDACPADGWNTSEYGQQLTRSVAADDGGRFLSSELRQNVDWSVGYFNGRVPSGTLLKEGWSRYEQDPMPTPLPDDPPAGLNRRVASTKTITNTGGAPLIGTASWTDNSDFDDYGHYRRSVDSGDFPSTSSRTRFTKYTPVVPVGTWLPGLSTEQCVADGAWTTGSSCSDLPNAEIIRTSFDPSTGALLARRTLLNPAGNGALDEQDLLATCEYDGHGDVLHEYFYGGTQSLSTDDGSVFTPPASAAYSITHAWTYANNEPITHTTKYEPFSFFISDEDIDRYTGLIKSRRDESGIVTSTSYDAAGRTQFVSQTGSATTNYAYTDPIYDSVAGLAPSTIQVATPSGQGLGSIATQYQYDALGRLYRQKTYMPDNTWSVSETQFHPWGAKKSISMMEALPAEGDEFAFTPSHKTTFTGYDAFERVGTTTAPDETKTTHTYTGVQTVLRSAKNADGTLVARTTENYDWRGRVVKVTEPSGQANGDVDTTYTYDVSDRLRSVHSSSGGFTQDRTFTYDRRGFLTAETHPEKAAFGVQYSNFDARGHAGRRQDGGDSEFDLLFQYDSAERLRIVSEHSSLGHPERILKEFEFADANGTFNNATDYRKGKLASAVRHNYTKTRHDVVVSEAYRYTGPGGRLSLRESTINVDGTNVQTFSTAVTWNDLGKQSNVGYPSCVVSAQCAGTNAIASVDQLFTNGALTRVGPSAAPFGTLGYHDNGMLRQVAHGTASSTITDEYEKDSHGVSRPAKISFNANSQCSAPAPVITVTSSMCAGASASASVNVQSGASYTWTVSGGTATSALTGSTITFSAPASGNVTLSVAAVNACGSAASTPAVVAVRMTTSITQQPAGASIAPGESATLQVGAAGDLLAYQWYRGASGDTSNPVSFATSNSYVAQPAVTTSYWVRVTGSCGSASSSAATVTVTSCPLPSPVIHVTSIMCPNDLGSAWTDAVAGTSHHWSISGGALASTADANEVTFVSGTSGSVTLTVTGTDSCGSGSATPAVVNLYHLAAITQQPSGSTIVPGASVTLNVGATGDGINYRWYTGQPGDTSNPAGPPSYSSSVTVSPATTTSYWVRVFTTCDAATSAAAVVTVYSPLGTPTGLIATTQVANSRNVIVQWNAVSGATGYQVRRATAIAGPFVTAGIPITSALTITDIVPATVDPVAYVYLVAAVDGTGESSNRSLPDYAVAATTLFSDEPLRSPSDPAGGTSVKGVHVAELRKAIDALRSAAGLSPSWSGAAVPTGLIPGSDYSSLKTPFDAARQPFGLAPFTWSGVAAPASGAPIVRAHIQQLRDALR